MIKNWWWPVVAVRLACGDRGDLTQGRYQGMIEHEQVDLGFEVSGRVAVLEVKPGQEVVPGAVIARLDDVLDRQTREIRARELSVARADLALVAAGSRAEDVRAARAQLAAARATELQLKKEVERDRALIARGVLAASVVDDRTAQLARATGERATLEERVRLLASGARDEELERARARVASAEQALALEDARIDKRILRASRARRCWSPPTTWTRPSAATAWRSSSRAACSTRGAPTRSSSAAACAPRRSRSPTVTPPPPRCAPAPRSRRSSPTATCCASSPAASIRSRSPARSRGRCSSVASEVAWLAAICGALIAASALRFRKKLD